jgi:hypothetical protein
MALKYLSHLETLNIDMQGYELQNAVIHTLTTATRPASPTEGQIIYNSSIGSLEIYNGSSWVSASGDITGVTAGSGLSGGGTSGAVTLNVGAGAGISVAADSVAVDYAGANNVILSAGAGSGDITTSMHIAVSDASDNVNYYDVLALPFSNNQGTVTSVGGTGTVSGLTLSGTVTSSGNLTLGGSLSLTSGQITAGLGFTPYDETNPDGFTSFAEPGIFSGGGTPTLASGVTGAEIRSLIGAGTSSTTGTVTSVAAAGNDGITVSGSPITSSGTITFGLADGSIDTAKLAADSITVGSTGIKLGGAATAIAGLTALDFAAGDRTIGASIGANDLTLGGATSTVVIPGDLRVDGSTTSVNSNEVNIGDAIIKLNADEAGAPSQNAGFEVERGTSANVSLVWDESADRWDFGAAYDVRANAFIGDLEGTASDAGSWTTARTITLAGDLTGSVSIDGSANVTLTAAVAANSVALGTDTTGNYVASVTTSGALNGSASSEGAALALSVDSATTGQVGVVELATDAEAKTGTDTSRAVTPKAAKALVDQQVGAFSDATRTAGVIGDGASASIIWPHNLSARVVMIQAYDTASGQLVMVDFTHLDPETVRFDFAIPPAPDSIMVMAIVAAF